MNFWTHVHVIFQIILVLVTVSYAILFGLFYIVWLYRFISAFFFSFFENFKTLTDFMGHSSRHKSILPSY